jgi:hypothetical protein
MRLNEQRDTLLAAVDDASRLIHELRCRVLRKTTQPYGDGSRSDVVNVNSDVLPQLVEVLDRLQGARDQVTYG